MEAFVTLRSTVLPIDRPNVDTDAIIPKQFMKSIQRTGFGQNLFDAWRYMDVGEPGMDCSRRPKNPTFPINQPRYQGAQILLARENFGCGSSREHAAWALHDYGIRALIAPSYADIFFGNCFNNGMLPIVVEPLVVDCLFEEVKREPGYSLIIDLSLQTIATPNAAIIRFDVDQVRKERLLNGLDDIALTLEKVSAIRAYEERRRVCEPWLFRA